MSNVDVEALRGLLAEATPGPWRLEVDESWGDKDTSVVSDKGVICCDTNYYPTAVAPNDQALIAAAITALPALLDELTRLRAFREAVMGAPVVLDVTGKYGFVGRRVRIVPVDTDIT